MNTQLLLLINGWAGKSHILDGLMIFMAEYAVYIVFLVAILCMGVLLARRQWRPAFYFFLTLLISYILLRIAGLFPVDHRPFMDYKLTQLLSHAPGSSFPSDHTTVTTAIAAGLLFLTPFKKTGAVVLFAAVLIGFSRIFVGIHYPADILGGLIVGLLGGGVAVLLKRLFDKNKTTYDIPEAP